MADSTNKFYSRIQHKIDKAENWDKATSFIPLKGEIIVYTDVPLTINENEEISVTLFKVGDGKTLVSNLDFIYEDTMTHLSSEALRLAMAHTNEAIELESSARSEADDELQKKIAALRKEFEEYEPPIYELVGEKHTGDTELGYIKLVSNDGVTPLASEPSGDLESKPCDYINAIHDGKYMYNIHADKATADASGHNIEDTYATKAALAEQIAALDGNITGNTGFVETISQTDGIVTATRRALKAEDIPSHKSTTTDFGVGDVNNYGHLKLSDVFTVSGNTVITDNSNINNGIAATPAAVKHVYELTASNKAAINGINDASSGILAKAKEYTNKELEAYSTTENIAEIYETQEHATEEIERVENLISTEAQERAAADSLLQSQLNVLNGITATNTEGDKGKSVRTISQEEVAKIVDNAPGKFDTLKEIAEWIGTDTMGAADIATDLLDVRKEVYGTNDGEVPTEGKSRIDLLEEEVDDFKAEFASEIGKFVLKSDIEEADALQIVIDMGLISPVSAEDGSVYIDDNGAMYSL